jgi:hypothetical protein
MVWLVNNTPRPGKAAGAWYPLYRRTGWPRDRSGQVWKISPPPEWDFRTVQPVASRYTDYAIPVHLLQTVFTYLSVVLWPIRLNETRALEHCI